MPDLPDSFPALAIAVATGAIALAALAVSGIYATRRGLAAWRTARAAQALVTCHADALLERSEATMVQAARLGGGGERLAQSAASLQVSVRELRYLGSLVPRERARLRRRLVDLLLPTDDR